MVDKSDIARFVYNSDLNKKLATLATKTELKAGQDKIIKSQAFDQVIFVVKVNLKMMVHKII